MFGVMESLTNAAAAAASLPVTAVADVITLGGSLTDRAEPYTAEAAKGVLANLADAAKPGGRE